MRHPFDPETPRLNARQAYLGAVRDALRLPAWVVATSLLGVGSLARDVGHPAGAAVMGTLLIWAAPGQVILYAGLASGAALPALAVAICLSSIRFLPMTMSILPLLRVSQRQIGTQFLAAHFVAVTVWTESMRRLPSIPIEIRLPYYFGFASACIGLSALSTYLGYYLVAALPLPLAAALLLLTPLFFTLSLVAGAARLSDWVALLLGLALAPVAPALVGRDFDLLAIGLVGGTLAYLAGRLRRTPAP